jgi:hypothetical protein
MALRTFIRFIGKPISKPVEETVSFILKLSGSGGRLAIILSLGFAAHVRLSLLFASTRYSTTAITAGTGKTMNQVSCNHDSFMLSLTWGAVHPLLTNYYYLTKPAYFFFVTKSGAKENIDAMLSSTLI